MCKHAKFSESSMHLIQSMLEYDPAKRLTLKEIQVHEWFNELDEDVSQEDVRNYFTVRADHEDTRTRGAISTRSIGKAEDLYEGFKVQLETVPAYSHDATEFILAANKKISDVVKALEEFC